MTRYTVSLIAAVTFVASLVAPLLLLTEPGAWWWNPAALAALGGTVIALVAIILMPW